MWWHDRRVKKNLEYLAKGQAASSFNWKDITKELLVCGLPIFLGSSMIEANAFINNFFYANAMEVRGHLPQYISDVYSLLNVSAYKIACIPQVLATGFAVAIIPIMTSSLVKKDFSQLKKQANDVFNSATYIALPIIFCLLYFSSLGYSILYGYDFYELGGEVLSWLTLLSIVGSILPLASSIAMSIRLRRKNLRNLLIGLVVKLACTYHLILWYGYPGWVISSSISAFVVFSLNIYDIAKTYNISFKNYFVNTTKILVAILAMYVVSQLMGLCGLNFSYQNQFKDLLLLVVYGFVNLLVYLVLTAMMKLPQEIFSIDFKEIAKKLKLNIL
jgi:O-antigen/teichoic acid export membrane protein